MAKYRWGIIGAGQIAHEFAKALRVSPGAVLHSVYSRSLSKARDFVDIYGFEQADHDLDSFLDDSRLDIVYIATPNHLHCSQAVLCMEAGKHVLVEKPIGLSSAQARKIQRVALQRKRFCMEAMWTRFIPLYRRVHSQLRQNVIGEIRSFDAAFGYAREYEPKRREFDPELGGGSLLDLGVYPISLVLMLLGKPEKIAGSCHKTDSGIDSMARICLQYPSGASVGLHCSFEAELANSIWIAGDRGSIHIHNPIYRPCYYSLQHYTPQVSGESVTHYGLREKLNQAPIAATMYRFLRDKLVTPVKKWQQIHYVPYLANGYQYEVIEVMDSLRRGRLESDIMPLEDSVRVLEITDTLLKSWGISYPHE